MSAASTSCECRWDEHGCSTLTLGAQGATLGSMRHGWGRHACTNGDSYTGNWRLDRRHGRGRAAFASGVEYEGGWRDDKAEGCARTRAALSRLILKVNRYSWLFNQCCLAAAGERLGVAPA